MSTTLTAQDITATSANIAFTNLPAGGWVEIQIADNPDFRGLVSWRRYDATPGAAGQLNQLGTYYARGRTVTAGGALGTWGTMIGFYTPAGAAWDTAPKSVLVSPAIIVVPEPILSLSSTLAGVAGYPATNMLRDDPQLIYAYDGSEGTATYIYFQTAGQPIDTIAVLDTLAGETTEVILRAANAKATLTANGHDYEVAIQPFRASANLPQRRGYHGLWRLPAPQTYPFWRIHVVGSTRNQQQLFQARYLVVGLARTAKNISADKIEVPLDLGSIDRTRTGGPDRIWGHRMRKVDFEIALLREMQWETQFADLWRKIALTQPVMGVPNSRTGAFLHDRILYGTVSQMRATNVSSPVFSYGLSIESLI